MDNIIFKVICVTAALIMLVYYAKRKHTVRSALAGMVSGGTALLLLHYYGSAFGYAPPVNLFNTAVSLILGIPGAAAVMAANLL